MKTAENGRFASIDWLKLEEEFSIKYGVMKAEKQRLPADLIVVIKSIMLQVYDREIYMMQCNKEIIIYINRINYTKQEGWKRQCNESLCCLL